MSGIHRRSVLAGLAACVALPLQAQTGASQPMRTIVVKEFGLQLQLPKVFSYEFDRRDKEAKFSTPQDDGIWFIFDTLQQADQRGRKCERDAKTDQTGELICDPRKEEVGSFKQTQESLATKRLPRKMLKGYGDPVDAGLLALGGHTWLIHSWHWDYGWVRTYRTMIGDRVLTLNYRLSNLGGEKSDAKQRRTVREQGDSLVNAMQITPVAAR